MHILQQNKKVSICNHIVCNNRLQLYATKIAQCTKHIADSTGTVLKVRDSIIRISEPKMRTTMRVTRANTMNDGQIKHSDSTGRIT